MFARLLTVSVLGTLLAACAGPSWQQVRTEDSFAGYRRYLAEHPDSPHAAEARERLAVLHFDREPSIEALERFRRDHPNSSAIAQLAERAEQRLFDAARAQATADAYDRFLETFPDGSQTRRAFGNREYLRSGGFVARPAALRAFLQEHPESDYAAEARRSLQGLDARRSSAFHAISLRIEVAPDVPEADRLRTVFAARAQEIYADSGLRLTDGAAAASLVIRHRERTVAAGEAGDVLAKPGVLAETELTLSRGGEASPDFRDVITWRVPASDVRPGGSALFASSSGRFWERFHVPVATWATSSAKRGVWHERAGALAGVGGDVGRAVVLAPDGSFRVLDLSDPAAPHVVARYARLGPVARFSSARSVAGRIVLFGEDGAEIVAPATGGFVRVASYDRGAVGAVVGVEGGANESLLLAGSRGFVRVPLDGGPAERLIERPLRGIARSGDTLFLLDDRWLYSGPLSDPRPTQFFTALDLGRAIAPRGLSVSDGIGVVHGEGGLAIFASSGPGPARLLARMRSAAIGSVSDASVLAGAVFALGERGLLVLDPASGRILDSVDVDARASLARSGSHFVAMDRDHLEIVDAAPWIAREVPAALAP
ncbi:MAG: hypothetical protein DCC71_10355 [Proteobacteria bacterium]|nr:MAG: hypothetical protein DCC71_10355 [Pseudomonadota bacterium]